MPNNYLLFMPSLMRSAPNKISYTAPDGSKFEGLQTNIATTEYVLQILSNRGEKLNKILMICSHEVQETPISLGNGQGTVTTYEYYVNTITAALREKGYESSEIASVFFPYKLSTIESGNQSGMQEAQNAFFSQIDRSQRCNLFVDYTGGLRSASMILVLFAKLLEKNGMVVEDVFYSNISSKPNGNEGRIESCKSTYDMFDYFSALDEAKRGNTKAMGQYFENKGDKELAAQMEQTAKAKEKRDKGQYDKITAEERSDIAITEKMSLFKQTAAKEANDQRKSLDRKGAIADAKKEGDVSKAAQRIREQGLDMLIEKGIVRWSTSDYYKRKDNRNNAFYAYAHYYRSYLDFVNQMLLQLDLNADGTKLRDDCDAYVNECCELRPVDANNSKSVMYSLLSIIIYRGAPVCAATVPVPGSLFPRAGGQ